MNNDNNKIENIQLSLPINAAYVSAARLTASSIANRMVFDIDEIEDIKAAVSEACTFFIKSLPTDDKNNFTIMFSVEKGALKIVIGANMSISQDLSDEEMGLLMIKALMDEFEITNGENNNIIITMVKKHKELSFD